MRKEERREKGRERENHHRCPICPMGTTLSPDRDKCLLSYNRETGKKGAIVTSAVNGFVHAVRFQIMFRTDGLCKPRKCNEI